MTEQFLDPSGALSCLEANLSTGSQKSTLVLICYIVYVRLGTQRRGLGIGFCFGNFFARLIVEG